MKMRPILLQSATLALLVVCDAASQEDKPPIPDSARVTISFNKNEFLLGENVLVHFTVENAGEIEFSVRTGGDYRGSPRHLRFKVTATAEDGTVAADPHPKPFCMGGLSSAPPVKPGGKFEQSLALTRYCRIDQPGTYTVRVSHDLGWKPDKDGKYPEAVAKVTFVMPTPDQARKVVEAMYALPEDTGATVGQRSNDYPDFSTLRYPVYLPILAERAAKDCEKALCGIGQIATPEATLKLIELAADPDAGFRVKAVRSLYLRLPDPYLEKKLPSRGFWEDTREGERRWMVQQAWRPEFAVRARKLIPLLFAHDTLDSVACGAFLCECVGDKEDAPHLLRALDGAIIKTKTAPFETSCYPRPRGNCAELLRAAEMLLARGADVPTVPTTPGEAVFLAMASSLREGFRPPGLKAQWVALLEHEIPYVREKALDYAPLTLTNLLLKQLPALLADADVDVQIAACHVAEKLKAEQLREPAVKVLATAKEDWLFRAAVSAAYALGGKFDACEALAARLDDPEMVERCLERLARLFTDTHPASRSRKLDAAAAKALKERWLKFFAEHGKALREGRMFKVGDPEVTADLFAGCVQFKLPDGKLWPDDDAKR